MSYEPVHTVWDYYDGPRAGVANYQGVPHYFACSWDVKSDDYTDIFTLAPIDDEMLQLALEQWKIWRDWERRFHSGEVAHNTHPGHGGSDPRYDELQATLDQRVQALDATVRAKAKFRSTASAPALPVGVLADLEVEWSPV